MYFCFKHICDFISDIDFNTTGYFFHENIKSINKFLQHQNVVIICESNVYNNTVKDGLKNFLGVFL